HIVGLGDETWTTLKATRSRLAWYQGDWLNAMYVTPHDWTEFGRETLHREVVERDQRNWDYRHQVLGQRHLRPWQLFLWVKWAELWFPLRPRRLLALLRARSRFCRQMWWVMLHIGLVWLGEILEFVRNRLQRRTPTRTSRQK